MIYPNFLKKNDLIGITALSSGCDDSLNEFQISLNNLSRDYKVLVTNDVYGNHLVSASKEIRSCEFNDLLDKCVKMIYIARGGDYLIETIPYIDFDKIKNNPVWIQGYSDPTSLLYILTTKYGVATIYGLNGKGYDSLVLEKYHLNNLEINKGNLVVQESFMDRNTISLNGNFTSEGIIIGGCIEVLKDIFDTKYDATLAFINRYKDCGIVWYFDIFNMTSCELMETLKLFKDKGWFRYTSTILFGTVMFKNATSDMTYVDAIKKVFDNSYNVVMDANIGHVKPSFTIINGSMVEVSFKGKKLVLKQRLLEEE